MATTIAQLTLTSTDLLSDSLAVSAVATLTAAGSSTGLTRTEGLGRKQTANTSEYTLFAAADYTDDKAHKVYIRNASTSKANFFYVAYNASAAAADTAETIGKLYGGDWMLMPYDGNVNITVASSTASETQYLEYMVFADGIVEAKG